MTIPFFNPNKLPTAKNEYVCWIDVSGTRSTLSRSIKASAVSIFKLHDAILNFKTENINCYPVMDGAYITSRSYESITTFLRNVFNVMAESFISTELKYKFFIKASVAYGPIIHGKDIPDEASFKFRDNPEYRASLLIGMPMIQAAKSESLASPFGIYIHESARAFSENGVEPFTTVHWQWFKSYGDLGVRLLETLEAYFDWCEKSNEFLGYAQDRIKVHKEQSKQFFEFDI